MINNIWDVKYPPISHPIYNATYITNDKLEYQMPDILIITPHPKQLT